MKPVTLYTAQLPPEIWLLCLASLSRKQLSRVARVCRLFLSLSLPLLWLEQTFDASANFTSAVSADQVRYLHRTQVRMKKVAEGPYASLIRFLTVQLPLRTDHVNPESRWARELNGTASLFLDMRSQILSTSLTTIAACQNLETLHLEHFRVDDSLVQTLASMPSLVVLRLVDCEFENSESQDFLPLEHLKIERGFGREDAVVRIASPRTLRTLEPGNYLPQLTRGFGAQPLPHLVELTIQTPSDLAHFIACVDKLTGLESLTMGPIFNEDTISYPPLPPRTLPRLRTLAATPEIHQWLVPGRPVSSVTISLGVRYQNEEHDKLVRTCVAIAGSTAPIRSLTIVPPMVPKLEPMARILALFPRLQEFCYAIDGGARPGQPGDRLRFRRLPQLAKHEMRSKPAVDQYQPPELIDDLAFDELSEDDISDEEEEVQSGEAAVVEVSRSAPEADGTDIESHRLQDTLGWLVDGRIELAPTIEVLKLQVFGLPAKLPFTYESRVFAHLVGRYPHLREVQFGSDSHRWERICAGAQGEGEGRVLWKPAVPGKGNARKAWVKITA
ncbi:hypothetical protein FB45DRAFT_939603 [Roridomyces roridus]|uniref:F-box domain-containing protein n=1 Tax=Roridomyces roridus TaxID=1738132 RepID=A0AAD7FAS9_9AGAR|nr:hypothetical protein FB45DRAFT_939603 [Roridomyces roridus]